MCKMLPFFLRMETRPAYIRLHFGVRLGFRPHTGAIWALLDGANDNFATKSFFPAGSLFHKTLCGFFDNFQDRFDSIDDNDISRKVCGDSLPSKVPVDCRATQDTRRSGRTRRGRERVRLGLMGLCARNLFGR
jgi:hypothetical protein